MENNRLNARFAETIGSKTKMNYLTTNATDVRSSQIKPLMNRNAWRIVRKASKYLGSCDHSFCFGTVGVLPWLFVVTYNYITTGYSSNTVA